MATRRLPRALDRAQITNRARAAAHLEAIAIERIAADIHNLPEGGDAVAIANTLALAARRLTLAALALESASAGFAIAGGAL